MTVTRRLILTDLPPEILLQIFSNATSANFLRCVALTCRTLNKLIKLEGWKTFTLTKFPSFKTPPCWNEAAQALTALSRNFDRRALIACSFPPHNAPIHTLPDCNLKNRWDGPQGQTMGYQPVLDSYEEWVGKRWNDRKEVVAWGAGAELVVKVTDWGGNVFENDRRNIKHNQGRFGNTHIKYEWLTYKESQHLQGRDDITTLKLLRPEQVTRPLDTEQTVSAIVGRASGELKHLRLAKGEPDCVFQTYETQNTSVRSADISTGLSPLLLACLGDSRAALYQVNSDEGRVDPASEITCISRIERACRTWTTKFLSQTTVAIGRGTTKHPVVVYQVTPDGITEEPIRIFGSGKGLADGSATSVYPIVKVPSSSSMEDSEGQEFFSGGYDGLIRLHDMRSPSNCEAIIEDPTEFSAVFSLLMIGRERLLAGTAANSLLKIFDLRMIGGRVYSYMNTNDQKSTLTTSARRQRKSETETADTIYEGGWNLFTSPRSPDYYRHRTNRRAGDSPVYSLSSPSPYSPNIYAGVEDNVVHLNFTSMLDEYPDPLFRKSLFGNRATGLMVRKTWDPVRKCTSLNMYEQGANGDLPLRRQRLINTLSPTDKIIPGYDERWTAV